MVAPKNVPLISLVRHVWRVMFLVTETPSTEYVIKPEEIAGKRKDTFPTLRTPTVKARKAKPRLFS